MRDILVFLIVFGSLPVILMKPWVGILVWSWLGFMNPHRLAWGFATTFPFAQAVAIVTILGTVFSRDIRRFALTRETVVLALFVLWMFVTTNFALVPEGAWPQWDKVSKIMLVVFMTMMLMREHKRMLALIWVIVLSIGFYAVKGGIFTLRTGGRHLVWGPEGTFLGGNNEAGLAFLMIFPLMRYLQLTATSVWVRRGLLLAMVLTGVAILGTASRGAFLGLCAMSLMIIWKSRKRLILAVLVAVAIPFTLTFMPSGWKERMESIKDYRQDESAMGRINAWGFAVNIALERPLGGGFETFDPTLFELYAPRPYDFHDAHSVYFEVLGEHGFIGLSLFLLLGFLCWRSCSWIIRQGRKVPEISDLSDLARMIQVSFVGYAVTGAFLGMAYFDLVYSLVAIVVIAKILAQEQVMKSGAAESSVVEDALVEQRATTYVPSWTAGDRS